MYCYYKSVRSINIHLLTSHEWTAPTQAKRHTHRQQRPDGEKQSIIPEIKKALSLIKCNFEINKKNSNEIRKYLNIDELQLKTLS